MSILSDIGIAGGCLFILAVTCLAGLFAMACAADRGQPQPRMSLAEVAREPEEDAAAEEGCPWCDVSNCIDSRLCTCADPCGQPYCKAPGAVRDA